MHTGTLSLKQPLRPWYYTGKHLQQKWTAMIDPSTFALYIQKPNGIEVHHPINSLYQFSHYHRPSYIPINTVPMDLIFTTNTNTILPFNSSTRSPPSPNNSTFLSYIHSLPQWEQLLFEQVQLHTDTFTLASHLSQSENKWIAVSNVSIEHFQASFGWAIVCTSRQHVAQCNVPAHRHKPTSYRSEGYGILSLLQFVLNQSTYSYQTTPKHLTIYTDSESWVKTINAVMWDKFFLNETIITDWDILQNMILSLIPFQHKPQLSHIIGHHDAQGSYAQLPLPAQLNVDTNGLTSRYRAPLDLQLNIILAITGCNAYVSIMGNTIMSNFTSELGQAASLTSLEKYVSDKYYWSTSIYNTLDWTAHYASIKKSSLPHKFIIKFIHGWLPLGNMMHRYHTKYAHPVHITPKT